MYETTTMAFLDQLAQWYGSLPAWLTFVLVAALVLIAGHVVGRPLYTALLRHRGYSEVMRDSLEDAYTTLLVVVSLLVALTVAHVGPMPTAASAVLAAATLSAGIGAREIIRNLVSGFFILNNEDIDIGSWIEWDDHAAVVRAISFRVTKLETFDSETVLVPNSNLTDDIVVNPMSNGALREHCSVGIGYEDDVEQARDVLLDIANSHPNVADDPAPAVVVTELGPSAVGLDVRFYVENPTHARAIRTQSDITESVKRRFQEEGITMPCPVRTLQGSIDVSTVDAEN